MSNIDRKIRLLLGYMQCLIFKHIFSDAGLQSQRTARQSDQEAGKAANEGVPVVRGDVALLGNLLNQCFQ